MNIPWEDLQLFLAVAEARSMNAAARRLQVGQPTVSRRLAELEQSLGAPLFVRTVSGVQLTAAGERLLEPARRMAEWATEAARLADAGDPALRGTVRVTAPPGVAFELLAPFARRLRGQHPALRLEVLSTISYLDLTRGEADLALRAKAPTQPELLCLARCEQSVAAFVSRTYLAKLPKRYSWADLDWIGWAPPYDQLPPNPQLAQLIPHFTPAFTSDSFLIHRAAAEAGVGAIFLPYSGDPKTAYKGLAPLKLDLGPLGRTAMYLVCAKRALEVPRVRIVAELLGQALSAL